MNYKLLFFMIVSASQVMGQAIPCGTSPTEKLILSGPPEYLNGVRTAIASSLRGKGIHREVEVSQIRYEVKHDLPTIKSFLLKGNRKSWVPTKPFIPLENRHSIELMTLVRSRYKPDVVYKVRSNVLMRSSDGGNNWKAVTIKVNGLPLSQFVRSVSDRTPAVVDTKIAAVHPSNPNILFASFIGWEATEEHRLKYFIVPGLYTSQNGGENWALFSSVLVSYDVSDTHPILGISPSNPSVMLGHGNQGLVLTKDGGRNWAAVGQQRELEVPVEIEGREAALKKLGLHVKNPSWNRLDVYQVDFQWDDEKVIYLGTSKGIYKSMDLGQTWRLLDVPVKILYGTNSFVTNLDNPLDLLVGSIDGAYLSGDGGCHFKKIY